MNNARSYAYDSHAWGHHVYGIQDDPFAATKMYFDAALISQPSCMQPKIKIFMTISP
jgi:hypothetical protein